MYGMLPANESDWPITYSFSNVWSMLAKERIFVCNFAFNVASHCVKTDNIYMYIFSVNLKTGFIVCRCQRK